MSNILTSSIFDQGKIHGKIHIPGQTPDSKIARGLLETSEYSLKSFPWMVEFHYVESDISSEFISRTWWLRAPDPQVAAYTATALWRLEERTAKRGFKEGDRFPEIAGPAHTTCIDEQDYMQAWKDAQRWPKIWKGEPINPAAFTFFPDKKFTREWFGAEYFMPKHERGVVEI